MRRSNVFRARAFRLALAFALAISAATVAAFAFVYFEISRADSLRVGAVLVDEAEKSAADSEERLRRALALRLTRDIRRLDYVALFDPSGRIVFGDLGSMPPIPVDGRAHLVSQQLLPDASGVEPALFVARRRPDGGVVVLGRSLREVYDLQETVLRALAVALLPTVLVILAIGNAFARRASRRQKRIQDAITQIMDGHLHSRLPVNGEGDDIETIAKAINLMLDEIERLLDQLKSIGDNIAHDLRTPLMVARAKIVRALGDDADRASLNAILEGALSQIDRASIIISAILRVSAVENKARRNQFTDFDLGAVCADLADFYEPLAASKSIRFVAACDHAPMHGDEDLIREAVSNLIDNAIKFTPEGGAIRIETRMENGAPLLAVCDTGVGVPAEDRTRIFRRFFHGEGADGAHGQGLGLSIAKTIVDLHGFDIVVEDNRPGARFVIHPAGRAARGSLRSPETEERG